MKPHSSSLAAIKVLKPWKHKQTKKWAFPLSNLGRPFPWPWSCVPSGTSVHWVLIEHQESVFKWKRKHWRSSETEASGKKPRGVVVELVTPSGMLSDLTYPFTPQHWLLITALLRRLKVTAEQPQQLRSGRADCFSQPAGQWSCQGPNTSWWMGSRWLDVLGSSRRRVTAGGWNRVGAQGVKCSSVATKGPSEATLCKCWRWVEWSVTPGDLPKVWDHSKALLGTTRKSNNGFNYNFELLLSRECRQGTGPGCKVNWNRPNWNWSVGKHQKKRHSLC